MRPPDDRKARRTPAAPRREYSREDAARAASERAAQEEDALRAYWGENVLPLRRAEAMPDLQSVPREVAPLDALHNADFEESAPASTREALLMTQRVRRRGLESETARGEEMRGSEVLSAEARLKKARRERAPRTLRTSVWLLSALSVWMLLLVYSINNYRDYRVFQGLADQRQVQLAALETQLRAGQQKLAFMRMPQGHEQLMMERGYLRPGDRILLFPDEEKAAPKSDENREVAATLPAAPTPIIASNSGDQKTGAAWKGAADTVGKWYQTLREASGSSPDAP